MVYEREKPLRARRRSEGRLGKLDGQPRYQLTTWIPCCGIDPPRDFLPLIEDFAAEFAFFGSS